METPMRLILTLAAVAILPCFTPSAARSEEFCGAGEIVLNNKGTKQTIPGPPKRPAAIPTGTPLTSNHYEGFLRRITDAEQECMGFTFEKEPTDTEVTVTLFRGINFKLGDYKPYAERQRLPVTSEGFRFNSLNFTFDGKNLVSEFKSSRGNPYKASLRPVP